MTTATLTHTEVLEAFVQLGFHMDASLDFRVKLPADKDATRRILEAAGCYNAFDPTEAFRVMDGWWDYVMRFELGREGSVALYATFPLYQHQALGNSTEGIWLTRDMIPVPTDTCRVFADVLSVELRDVGADELSYNPTTRVLRAWWD